MFNLQLLKRIISLVAQTWYLLLIMYEGVTELPYFLEISPRRHLISWSSLARRHFEGGD